MVFEVFRKKQKQMMAIMTIVAMFAFVLAGAFQNLISREGPGFQQSVVAKAWGEDITASQIQDVAVQRSHLYTFLFNANHFLQIPPPQPFDLREPAIIRSIVLEKKADQMGITFSDEQINNWINQQTGQRLSSADFYAVLNGRVGSPNGERIPPIMTEQDLYEAVRRLMKPQRVLGALAPPMTVALDTPYQKWVDMEPTQTHLMLNFVEIPVSKFIDKKAAPTEKQLEETYQKYKDQYANLEMGQPGFKVPPRAEAQYLVAQIEKFMGEVTVTDEEVAAYYSANKEAFRNVPGANKSVPMPPPTRNLPAPPTGADDLFNSGAVPAPPQMKKETPAETKPAPDAEKKPEAKSEPTPAPAKAEEKPAAATEKTEKKEEAKPAPANGDTKEEAKKDSSSLMPRVPGMVGTLAATSFYLQDDAKKDAPAAEAKPAAKEEAKPAAAKPEEDKPAAKAETPAPKADPKGEAKVDPKAEAKAEPKTEPKAAAPAQAANAGLPPAPTYKPLEEVKDEIVKSIKEQKAIELISERFNKIRVDVMDKYLDTYLTARQAYAKTAPKLADGFPDYTNFKAPPAPDLTEVAAKNGFELKSTGMVTVEQAQELPGLGNAFLANGTQMEMFPQILFDGRSYSARVVQDNEGETLFLFWRTGEEPAYTPPLDKIKDEVIAAWQSEQAAPAAKEAAEKLATKIRETDNNFAKALGVKPEYELKKTARPFPKYVKQFQTSRMAAPRYSLVTIPEIPEAGIEFLNKVFEAKVSDVVVVPDMTGRNLYVVQVTERVEPEFQRFVTTMEEDAFAQRFAALQPNSAVMARIQNQIEMTLQGILQEAEFQIANQQNDGSVR